MSVMLFNICGLSRSNESGLVLSYTNDKKLKLS